MKDLLTKIGLGVLFTVIIMAVLYGISWIITCGIIKLICLCFGWTFKWTIATGIWLIIRIAKSIFTHHTTIEK